MELIVNVLPEPVIVTPLLLLNVIELPVGVAIVPFVPTKVFDVVLECAKAAFASKKAALAYAPAEFAVVNAELAYADAAAALVVAVFA